MIQTAGCSSTFTILQEVFRLLKLNSSPRITGREERKKSGGMKRGKETWREERNRVEESEEDREKERYKEKTRERRERREREERQREREERVVLIE